MLRFIRIQNLAVIEFAEVDFAPGFNVLTGETGAGKSIVADAVDLLLGGRASAELVRTAQSHATIEAVFETAGREMVVRREISAQGRSRSFVDGAVVTAAQLRELAGGLVDIHGQHEQQRLLDPETHLTTLDGFAGFQASRAEVAECWRHLRELTEAHRRASMDARERSARLEWLAFQLAELHAVQPRTGEDEELAASKQRLLHADRVQRLCQESYDLLFERDDAATVLLGAAWKRIDELAQVDPDFVLLAEGRRAVGDYLDELGRALRATGEAVEDAGDRLTQVEDRLARLDRLKRQHGPALADVIARWRSLEGEREQLQTGAAPEALESEMHAAESSFLSAARRLSGQRREAAVRFSRSLEAELSRLAMEHTRLEVRFAPEAGPDGWSDSGVDQAEFFVSANVGEEPRPLARIASGGELSRVMLALHVVGLERRNGHAESPDRTLIFDEVDAGIGGRVADAVGESLRSLGSRFQVLCITHLAGIAARATAHFAIAKHSAGGRTTTHVDRIDGDARVGEIARMLTGAQQSDASRAAASQLLEAGDYPTTGESRSPGKGRKRKS